MPTRLLSDEQRRRYGRYVGSPTRDQLARYFHLDAADQEALGRLRGDHNRIGFALQLGTARFLGVLPTDFDHIPDNVIVDLAWQLGLGATPSLETYRSGRPRRRHAALIREIYGFRDLAEDKSARFRLTRWLYTLCWSGDDRPSLLIDRATAWMVAEKILLPGISTVERLVARIRDRAHRRLWHSLANRLSDGQRQQINALLEGEGGAFRKLDALRAPPTRRMPSELTRHFQRLDEIRAFNLTPSVSSTVPTSLIHRLAKIARSARPSAIAVLKEPRRTATVTALFHTLEALALDDAVELFDALAADVFREAVNAHERTRLKSLGSLDTAALTLRDIAKHVMADPEDDLTFANWRERLFDQISGDKIESAVACIDALAEPPGDRNYEELRKKWRTAHHLFRSLLQRVEFDAVPAGRPVKNALDYLAGLKSWTKTELINPPNGAVRGAWRPHIFDKQGRILDHRAYVFAILEAWRTALKKRDIFIRSGIRFSDPRQGLLDGEAWRAARLTVCRSLDKSLDAQAEVAALTNQLDHAYRQVAGNFDANPAARIETKNGKPALVMTPLDRLDEPESLIALKAAMRARMPKVDLSDVLMEIAHRTDFAKDFTHVSERRARVEGFEISLCATLLAEACNIGFEPLAQSAFPPLRRDRMSWVSQNFLRAETIAVANARIVAAHSALPIVQCWGAGDVASADGVRFAAPTTVIHAGPNPKYFKSGRGITLYNLVSDQFTGLNALVVPGTLRDSLFILALLLDQETDLEPTEIMTDTAAYSDVVFGLFWLLGYQFSPRLADMGQARLWRVDRKADYGALDPLVRQSINTKLIVQNWKDLLRLAGSLRLDHIHAGAVMRVLQAKNKPTTLARALAELGRIAKSMHILSLVDDEGKRRRTITQLNRQEYRHRLARRVCHGERGEIRKPYRQGQEEQLGTLGFTLNVIAYWNALYMQAILEDLENDGWSINPEDVARLSPLAHRHINFLGRYAFALPETIAAGALRPLREPTYE